jgi:hypothetical protein
MIVLHPNTEQYNALNGYFNNCYKLEFAKDGSGRWIAGLEVLECKEFQAIYNQLEALERIEYTPIIE